MSKFQFRIGQTEDGKPVKIDLDTFIHTRAALFANSGGGKTTTLYTLIERSIEKVPWIIVDPEGEYSPLREQFPTMLLVGKDGEVPVDLRSAKLLARKIMELRLSTIVDLYSLIEIRAEWVAEFITALINLPKDLWSPMIVAIDEGHRLAPETPTGDKRERDALYRSRKAIITLSDSGRKQHRGAIVATQRVAKMAMDARAELRNTFTGLQVRDNDRKRAGDDLGFSKEQTLTLRDLAPGQFYVYGPALIGVRGVEKIQIDLSQTKPPRVGTKDFDIPPASDALRKLVSQIGNLPQQAETEARTLADAQRKIGELERQLRARPTVETAPRVETRIERVEIPVFGDGDLPQLAAFLKAAEDLMQTTGNLAADVRKTVETARQMKAMPERIAKPAALTTPRQVLRAARASQAHPLDDDGEITRPQQAILDALARFEAWGLSNVVKQNAAVFADQSPSSSGFTNNLGRLRTLGLVEYPTAGRVALTGAGRARANSPAPVHSIDELHEAWYAKLSKPKAAILRALIAQYPDALTKEELAELSHQSATSSGFTNNLGALRSLGIVDYPKPGFVAATKLLFPDL